MFNHVLLISTDMFVGAHFLVYPINIKYYSMHGCGTRKERSLSQVTGWVQ